MGDFVKPEAVRLDLRDDRYIIIKKRLSHGEREDMFARMSPYVSDEPHRLDRREVRTAKVLAYLLGWSLTDGEAPGEGMPVPMAPDLPEETRVDTLRMLDPDSFLEMYEAISAHEERQAQKKMVPRGEPASSAISLSPVASVGATSGSVS